jgi:tetratricopeptide (TPR) repeat protein
MAAVIIHLRDRKRSKPIKPPSSVTVKDVEKRGGVQRAWDFEGGPAKQEASPQARVVHVVPAPGAKIIPFRTGSPHDQAYKLYVRASAIDEEPGSYKLAESLYRQALELDPDFACAYTNLGNVLFRRGDERGAEALWEKAISIDERQPEAHYNLGYLRMEQGRFGDAIKRLRKAVECDGRFADAHFNLAMSLEQSGGPTNEDRKAIREQARTHWRRYLDLEPSGTWADIARAHLQ